MNYDKKLQFLTSKLELYDETLEQASFVINDIGEARELCNLFRLK